MNKLKIVVLITIIFSNFQLFATESTSINVSIFKYANKSQNSNYNYLSNIIIENIIKETSEDKDFAISQQPHDSKILRILENPEEMISELKFLADTLGTDYIIFGRYHTNSKKAEVIIDTYIYNRSKNELYKDLSILARIGAKFTEDIDHLSLNYYNYMNDNFEGNANSNQKKFYNKTFYSLFSGWSTELTYGYLNFGDDWDDKVDNTYYLNAGIYYDFFLDNKFQETPILNISSIGIKYSYFEASTKSGDPSNMMIYFNGVAGVYNILFRPWKYFSFYLELTGGYARMHDATNPVFGTNYTKNTENGFFKQYGIGSMITLEPIIIYSKAGLVDMSLDENPDMNAYYLMTGIGFRF